MMGRTEDLQGLLALEVLKKRLLLLQFFLVALL